MENFNWNSRRRLQESVIWWTIVGTWVSIERLINQWADISTVLSAWWIQGISTFLMALGCISFYDWMIVKIPWELSESMKKIAIWWSLATLSGTVNYVGQLKTQWSLEESIVMFSISGTGLLLYELEIVPKIKQTIKKNKYTILESILNIGNTLWWK